MALADTVQPVTIIIDFNAYDNNGNWSSPSLANFGNTNAVWDIQAGKLRCSGPAILGSTTYRKGFLALQRCATDNIFAEVTIGSAWTAAVPAYDREYVRCSIDGSAGVAMAITQTGTGNATVTIETVTDMINGGTVRATSSGTFQALPDDVFRIEAVHDDTAGYSTFTCYRNGDRANPIAVWADTGNVAPRGVAWRRAGHSSTAASFSFNVYRAASADTWRAGDLT